MKETISTRNPYHNLSYLHVFLLFLGKSIRNVARKNKSDTKSDITFEEFITFVIHRSGKSVMENVTVKI